MNILSIPDRFKDILTQWKKLNRKSLNTRKNLYTESDCKHELLNSVILESLNESEREKEKILNSLVEEVCYMDLDYNILWLNNAGLNSIPENTKTDSIIGKPCYKVRHGYDEPCDNCPVSTTIKTGWPWKEEITHKNGLTKLISSQPLIDDNGDIKGIIEVDLDITMRKEVEHALEKSRQRSKALLDVIPDLLFMFNSSGQFIDYHAGTDLDLITNSVNPEGKHLTEVMPERFASEIIRNSINLSDTGSSRSFEFTNPEEDSDTFYDCRLIKTAPDENVCIIRDVSQQKSHLKDIVQRSFHDSLTGLYNRGYFEEEIKRIEHSRQSLPVSVLIIDVNGLKLTNDAFGHDFGDKLLKIVADILSSNCRKSDVISRTGGDEFSILLPSSPLKKAKKLADRIVNACNDAEFDDIYARPSVSVGYAEKTDNSVSLHDTIKLADERMYEMKLTYRAEHLKTLVNDIINTMKSCTYEKPAHLSRCIELSEKFAKINNLSLDSVSQIKKLALLHDIGNIRVSEKLLTKSEPLTAEEYDEIKQHSIIGYRIAKAIPDYTIVADAILYHHERWDGTGYPSGLKGKDIPLICRIFALIDSFDTITRGSCHLPAQSTESAILEIQNESGRQFDPDLTEIFIKFIKDENK